MLPNPRRHFFSEWSKYKTILVPQFNIGQFFFKIPVTILFSNNISFTILFSNDISSSDPMYTTSHSGFDTEIWICRFDHVPTYFFFQQFPMFSHSLLSIKSSSLHLTNWERKLLSVATEKCIDFTTWKRKASKVRQYHFV